jgi:hypothetical protein
LDRLDVFVPPRPNRALISAMTRVNRVIMLNGVPLLRDLWPASRVPGLRPLTQIRKLDLPAADEARLRAACGPGRATFITPNHPEFFTDWMIDKEIIARVSPGAASWATNAVVNGLGGLAQRFWLANNLIAQIPGDSGAARDHSVKWAAAGHGVLLHPEGAVGWHNDWVAPLLPGAVDMAFAALAAGRQADAQFQSFVAPIVWKLVFMRDVEPQLAREASYVEKRLGIDAAPAGTKLPERVYRIYDALLARDEAAAGVAPQSGATFRDRRDAVVGALLTTLDAVPEIATGAADDKLRRARRWLRAKDKTDPGRRKAVRTAIDTIARLGRLGDFAFARAAVSQEEIAEHLKRLRNDYCKGTLRDTLNQFLPQAAGPRIAHIRVPEPLAIHAFDGPAEDAVIELRRRMQATLDAVNAEIAPSREGLPRYPNPFYGR